MTYEPMADAAFAANIPPGFTVAAGYYPGRDDYHPWAPSDWDLFPGYRLPITVPDVTRDGAADGDAAVAYLRGVLHVPEGCITSLDLETNIAVPYVLAFGSVLQNAGYKVWPYGSASTIFHNPPLNGYWVADYTSNIWTIDQLLATPHVRAVQDANHPGYDASLVKAWTEEEMWHG